MNLIKKYLLKRSDLFLIFLCPLIEAKITPHYWQIETGLTLGAATENSSLYRKSIDNILTLENQYSDFFYKISYRSTYDLVYSGSHIFGLEAEEEYKFYNDWRHGFIGKYVGSGQVTIGMQQVVWGRADELRVLDQINPINYRNGVSELLDNSRVAVPMIRVLYPMDTYSIDAIITTNFRKNKYPIKNSFFYTPFFSRNSNFSYDEKKVSGSEDINYGINIEKNVGSIDVNVVALHSRQHDPVYIFSQENPNFLTEEFSRHRMVGGGIALDTGSSTIIRSEIAYSFGASLINLYETNGVGKHDYIKSLLGIDYLWKNWMVSAQWMNTYVSNWKPGLIEEKNNNIYTLSADGSASDDKITSRLAYVLSDVKNDRFFQAILKYKPNDQIRIGFQMDIFEGNDQGIFGMYREKDNVKLTLTYLLN